MRSICPGASMQVNGAVGTPRYASVSLVRPLCSDSASVSGSEPVYGMFRYSQIAGASEDEVLRKELVGFESDDAAEETESLLHRSDGRRIVPFRKRVTGTVGRCVGRGIGFFVVCETDSHVVSGDLLQKRPLVRSVNQNALSCRQ